MLALVTREEARVGVIYEPDAEAPRTSCGKAGFREYTLLPGATTRVRWGWGAQTRECAGEGVAAESLWSCRHGSAAKGK